jgi:branched-chain amino acid transport system substrate-binding protein
MNGIPRPRGIVRAAVLVCLIAFVGVIVAACGSSSSSSTSSSGSSSSSSSAPAATSASTTPAAATLPKSSCPVKILMVDNFSGASSQNGTTNMAGAKVALSQVNSAGGVLGCPVKITTVDDASNYATDLPKMEAALSAGHYAMVVNGDFACGSTAGLLARDKILSIAGCGELHFASSAYPLNFDVVYTEARAAMVAAQYGIKHGYKKWGLLVDNTAIGAGDAAAIKYELAKLGGTVVDTETGSLTGVDFTSAVQRLKAANPQVVFTDLFGTAAAHMKSDFTAIGWKVPQIGGFDEAATDFTGLVPQSDLAGQYEVSQATMAAPPNAVRQAFISKLHASGVSKITGFLFGYANGGDPITLFAWAANHAGSIDSQKVATYLHTHGNVPVPNLVQAPTTGYTPTCGEFNGSGGIAVMKAGYYDSNGQLPGVLTTDAPALPPSLADCKG